MLDEVTVMLTTPEALLFKDFMKYHETFGRMIQSGIFDIQFGKCTLNFAFGDVQTIVKEEVVYKKS